MSAQGGYPFTPTLSSNRSRDAQFSAFSQVDRVNLGTATVAPGQVGPDGSTNTTTATFVPYDPTKVITGNPNQWFNPYMFTLGPLGNLGDASRGMLRGPGLANWDLSLSKDTALRFLGEQGAIQFRADFFNLLNRANFGMPNGTVFVGKLTDIGAYSEKNAGITPSNLLGTTGQITATSTTSRQIQLSLRVIF